MLIHSSPPPQPDFFDAVGQRLRETEAGDLALAVRSLDDVDRQVSLPPLTHPSSFGMRLSTIAAHVSRLSSFVAFFFCIRNFYFGDTKNLLILIGPLYFLALWVVGW